MGIPDPVNQDTILTWQKDWINLKIVSQVSTIQLFRILVILARAKVTLKSRSMMETLKKRGGNKDKRGCEVCASSTGRSLHAGRKVKVRNTTTRKTSVGAILGTNIKDTVTQKKVEAAIGNFLRRSGDRTRYNTTKSVKALLQL
ncbi:uncharacterized protein LOC117175839 [Belonocnema kinseyi]|uniref:uncharacterized protein LOC117175839 n=1 Tax=Belonocnema kinseyi TaxID=2817044 RepID=UPI00143CDC8A|nr:uncharacterized protein LOC117175839 [Belonocnema kinseyi]